MIYLFIYFLVVYFLIAKFSTPTVMAQSIFLSLPITTNPKLRAQPLSRFFVNPSPKVKCPCHRSIYPVVQASVNREPYWVSINEEIESHLHRAIPTREPLIVYEPMNHLTFVGPRSMAPALCVAACELVGGQRAQALPAASALHVMNAAVQAHDYLPLTDQPRPKTRYKPINHLYHPSIELQTGDGLLAFGYELLAGLNKPGNSSRILQVIIEVSRAMGTQGIVEGQLQEVEYCHQFDGGEECKEGWLRQMYEKKHGILHACGAACGAILGEASEEEIEKLRKYGLYIGTIQGMLHGHRSKDKEVMEMIQSLRRLALKELEGFGPEKTRAISSFVNA